MRCPDRRDSMPPGTLHQVANRGVTDGASLGRHRGLHAAELTVRVAPEPLNRLREVETHESG